MTLRDGHGRTPHDTLEQVLTGAAMICCLPCLCFVGLMKYLPGSGTKKKEVKGRRGTEKEDGIGSQAEAGSEREKI
jgi:hypothetical protein